MSLLALRDLTVLRGTCPVVDHVSLTVAEGEFVGLIGPNGAGKTTLLRGALGLLPSSGLVPASLTVAEGEFVGLIGPNGAGKTTLLRGALGLLPSSGQSSLGAMAPRARARAAAFLPQGREIAWPVTVETVVALGRGPYLGQGAQAVDRALARMGLEQHRHRKATELSGGEQARVLIARALAQEAPLLLADEPVAGLDPEAQLRTMEVFASLAAEGRGVIASIHDLGLAARLCSRLILLHRGQVVAEGPPRDVLSDDNLANVFGVRGFHAETPDGPVFQPMGLVR